jgi:short-subunit dehydrogenase
MKAFVYTSSMDSEVPLPRHATSGASKAFVDSMAAAVSRNFEGSENLSGLFDTLLLKPLRVSSNMNDYELSVVQDSSPDEVAKGAIC